MVKDLTIEDCDARIAEYYAASKFPEEHDPENCMKQVNAWLDQRLALMESSGLDSELNREAESALERS